MPLLLLALFISVPLAEIAVFIMVGKAIGMIPTILSVIITAFIGTFLLRRQGLSAFARTQTALAEGRLPVESVIDGMCLLVAGAFLLTPGILTDTIGFLLFVPPLRRWLAKTVFHRVTRNMDVHVAGSRRQGKTGPQDDAHGPVIDGEYERVEPDRGAVPPPEPQNSPWRTEQPGSTDKPQN